MGYVVTRFPESDSKTPDLLAVQESEALVVECKSLGPTGSKPGRFGVRSDPHYRRAGIDSGIKKAAKQLKSSLVPSTAVRMVWLSSFGIIDSEFELERALGELLGLRTFVVPCPSGEGGLGYKAAFARPSRFERSQSIDLALLVSDEGALLYINPFSGRRALVKDSKIYLDFLQHRAVVDLTAVGPEDGYVVCDVKWNRADDLELRRLLAEKYGYPSDKVILVDFARHHLSVATRNHTGTTGDRPTE